MNSSTRFGEGYKSYSRTKKAVGLFRGERRGPVVPRKFLWNFQGHSKTIEVFEDNGRTLLTLENKREGL